LLCALPADVYAEVAKDLRLQEVVVGMTLQDQGVPITHVFFPNGGVYSMVNEMRNGTGVEVASVGDEGMIGVGAVLGDLLGSSRSLQQVPDGALPRMAIAPFLKHIAQPGPFRSVVTSYAQANVLQIMQCSACNVLHKLEQRCSRWLLQTHDRVGADEFRLKHELLATMLGATRPSMTKVLGSLQSVGAISSRYGRMRIVNRKKLERKSCECYGVIADHFKRLEG
jgi:CRP-like cAMP-binding protein